MSRETVCVHLGFDYDDSSVAVPRVPPPPPDPPGTCVCQGSDAQAAWEMHRSPTVDLIDESHLSVRLFRCVDCGQRFLQIFTELIDWDEGDDSQAWHVYPIDAEVARRLIARGEEVDEGFLLRLGVSCRHISRMFPRGCHDSIEWRDGPLVILPHD